MCERLLTLTEIAAEHGEDVAVRAAKQAVRNHPDTGEPYLTAEELERIKTNIMLGY